MTAPRQHWLLRLYPRAWRERYGDELSDLISSETLDWRMALDVATGAAREHLFTAYAQGAMIMAAYRSSAGMLVRTPSAYLPIGMSVLALMVTLTTIAAFGASRQADEGAAAHLFQLLMAGQVPLIAWFFLRHRRRQSADALAIVTLQAVAVGAALFPVWYFGL